MLLLISYDIHDDKRRYHVAWLLQTYGAAGKTQRL
jgi:CRISPR/Cas system-associated endoribonuclease Cas2